MQYLVPRKDVQQHRSDAASIQASDIQQKFIVVLLVTEAVSGLRM